MSNLPPPLAPRPYSGPTPRRTRSAQRALLLGGAALLTGSGALGQSDVERPAPNVLLLVDSSGSMEFRAQDNELPTCTPGNPGGVNQKSRWIDLVEVLTGTISQYSCFPMSRSSAAFRDEYKLDNVNPYDYNYVLPFNRIVSNGCTWGPGNLPNANAPYEWPAGAVNTFPFNAGVVNRGAPGCATFQQAQDGVLDIFREKVRFGLMTFDTHPHAGTGVNPGGTTNVSDGMAGTWSYFVGTKAQGRPVDCSDPEDVEVGARSAAAPPWEGRMVAFGPPNASTAAQEERSNRIQQVLLTTRPYGATPIAGMLNDARDFFWNDESEDPLNSGQDFGPRNDPAVKATDCRRSLIILLSDGEPNLDLRPHCEGQGEQFDGQCPYDRPESIAADLLSPNAPIDPDQKVETVVIGFALETVTVGGQEVSCDSEDLEAYCLDSNNANNRPLQACCTLNKIAAAGYDPPRRAHFPKNSKELRAAFSRILKDITVHLTTRTSAVYAAQVGTGASHQFSSSFRPLVEQPWAGALTRTRFLCGESGLPEEQPVEASQGDDFAANVNFGAASRKFVSFIPTGTNARATLRPELTSDPDGLGQASGTQTNLLTAAGLVSSVSAEQMNVTADDCDQDSDLACRDAILGWTLGLTNLDGESRCPSADDCNVFGAIYHSTPKIVPGRPREFLRDESYEAFARAQTTAERPSVLYAATIDGQLHALKTAPHAPNPEEEVNSLANNELWAFLPPAVLPALRAQYPNTPATLLDGAMVTRDVPGRLVSGKYRFERTTADAQAGAGLWRSVLVASYGKGEVGSGYFALDVTDPGAPRFLWQLTTDAGGKSIFGEGGAPLITTVAIGGVEVAVAVLPGGDGGGRTGASTSDVGDLMPTTDENFAAADQVNGYGPLDGTPGQIARAQAARALTIVRLDSGEVIRSFRAHNPADLCDSLGQEADQCLSAGRVSVTQIPAPIVGTPAAFPGNAGDVADRVFVGDREGRVYRVDVSKSDPSQWTMRVFFDAYFDMALTQRQPIELPPVVSVDSEGTITLAIATGEQRTLTGITGMQNRVVSLKEVVQLTAASGEVAASADFAAKVNWVETLGCATESCAAGQTQGERVTGPMALFGGNLYFASSSPAPSSADQCSVGSHRIWGVDYILSQDEVDDAVTIDPMNGAAGALPPPSIEETEKPKFTPSAPGFVFGVAIEQQPSCVTELEEFTSDPYLGNYGEHTSLSSINPGKFFLSYQVGGVTGSQGDGSKVPTEKVELQPPANSVWVDSWAAIFE